MAANNQSTRREASPQIRTLLSQVRMRIRRDAVAHGLLLLIIFLVGGFWATSLLEAGWFQLQRLELPAGLRTIVLFLAGAGSLLLIARRVLFPMFCPVTDADAAILLERRYPQFQDRLIFAVEPQALQTDVEPLSRRMIARATEEANAMAGAVSAEAVFDPTTLKRRGVVAGGVILSVLIVGVIAPQMLVQWWNAFVRIEPEYRQRTTMLELHLIAQPGDRRIAFLEENGTMIARHPRGADLELEMTVPPGGPEEGQDWIVPERVRLDVIRDDGSRSRMFVSRTSERTFRFVVTQLQEPVTIEVLAGDYRSTIPYRVEVVAMPALDEIQLDCTFPDYTGWNQLRERELVITGSEVQLPIGTTFQLHARSAKPLQGVRIVSDQFELIGDRERTQFVPADELPAVSNRLDSQPVMISADGHAVTCAFQIVADLNSHADQSSTHQSTAAHFIPASSTLRFFLHDTDDIMSVSPESLRVQGLSDAPPTVVAQMTGIGNAITRLARIPVVARVKDDYGIDAAGFEFLVDDETNWRPRPFRKPADRGVLEFNARRSDDEPFEVFDVQPLELSEGQSLTLSVVASDQCPSPSAGTTRGEPMVFRIVSNEELLSLLYTREIGLRGRFEEVIAQLESVRSDLELHREIAVRSDAAGTSATNEDRSSLNTCATRSGNNLRRQSNELQAISDGFDEIVRQLVNNAVPPTTLAENMRTTIVAPLKSVIAQELPAADRSIGALRAAVQEKTAALMLTQTAAEDVTEVIKDLRAILESVRDMAEFHEALRDLKAILDEQEQLLDNTRQLQKKELLDKLKVLD